MFPVLKKRYLLKLKTILHSNLTFLILIVFVLCYGIFILKYHKSSYKEGQVVLTAKILNISINEKKTTLTLQAEEKIKASSYQNILDTLNLQNGQIVKVIGNLQKPASNQLPNTFNYEKYLLSQKIFYELEIKEIEVIKPEISLFYKMKNYIINRTNNLKYTSNYVQAFILGDKSGISNDYKMYQELGVAHLFALSGLHINFLSLIIFKILAFFNTPKKVQYSIITIVFLIFLKLTNYPASLYKAVVFFFLKLLNKILKLALSNIRLFVITIMILLVINPYFIYDLGFLYSVSATLGLIISLKRVKQNYFKTTIKATIIATLFTLPISLSTNYYINCTSIINNLVFGFLVTFVAYPLALITFIIPYCSYIYNIIIDLTITLAHFLMRFNLNITFAKMPSIIIIAYYFLLISYFVLKKQASILCLTLLLLFVKIKPILDPNCYIIFLNVGQGDATLIQTPYQQHSILIDTGGKYNVDLSQNMITFFKSLGLNKLDVLVITHGDFDHMKEAINLASKFPIKQVIFNKGKYNELETSLIKILKEKQIPYYQNISKLSLGNYTLDFLKTSLYDNENDNSNILYFNYNQIKMLLMADASKRVEEELLTKYNLSHIDILKVAHHGSNTSSSKKFINVLNPRYSLISVGENNIYNHPHPEVLDNLKKSHVYQTNKQGTIIFKIKKNKLQVQTSQN